MDELARRLQEDAARIDVSVSPELDARIHASLAGTHVEMPASRGRAHRHAGFRRAAAMAGLGAAVAASVFVYIGIAGRPGSPVPGPRPGFELPAVAWQVQPVALTDPLDREYANLRADLEKVGNALRQDIDALF